MGFLIGSASWLRFRSDGPPPRTFGDGHLEKLGVFDPAGVRVVGPANLADIVRELAGVWGWDAVADAVAGQMGGGS